MQKERAVYNVQNLSGPVTIDANRDKKPWTNIETLQINNHMGEEPGFRPEVQAAAAYDSDAIYVIFHVEDRYVRSTRDRYQSSVCRDSCVEFFFTPGTDIKMGYFNIEINCGGAALFAFQKRRDVERIDIPEPVFRKIDLAHTMPAIVDPEITDPVSWTIEYRVPIDILPPYCEVTRPEPGAEWRANFYKIASDNSHPHYLTWSFVDHPSPDFHLPEFFGVLRFT